MKKGLLLLLFLSSSLIGFTQTENYGTKKISKWTFEKFPLHYIATPANAKISTNTLTGKTIGYQEYNESGQVDGLSLTMRNDGIYPSSASYSYKGVVVYSTSFFPNSNKAQLVVNFNEKGNKNGYRIFRNLKQEGGYTENIKIYKDGDLIESDGVKLNHIEISSTFNNNVLNGIFRIKPSSYSTRTFQGFCESGKLENIKEISRSIGGGIEGDEVVFLTDSIILKNDIGNGKTENYKYPLISNPIITDSDEIIENYGNLNGYPYLNLKGEGDFSIDYLVLVVTKHHPKPLKAKLKYTDKLLDGDFTFRTYISNNSSNIYTYTGEYYDISGKSVKGKLLNLSKTIIKINTKNGEIVLHKIIEYIFKDGEITQNDYVPKVTNEPISTKSLKLEYPVLLTNLKENEFKYGYFYFDKNNFDLSKYIRIITTKQKKPIEQNMNENNGLLDGDFEFEGKLSRPSGFNSYYVYGHVIGKANMGVIRNVAISYERKENYRNQTLYNKTEYSIKGDTLDFTLYLSNKKVYNELLQISKIKKLTNLNELSTYGDYIYYKDNDVLFSFLDNLQFLEKGETLLTKDERKIIEFNNKSNTYKKNKKKVNELYIVYKKIYIVDDEILKINKKYLFRAYKISINELDIKINSDGDKYSKEKSLTKGISLTNKMIELFNKDTKELEKSLKKQKNPTEILKILGVN